MKRSLVYLFAFLSLITFFSCQKELSFENSGNRAEGSLFSDISGECLPKTVIGTYIAGTALTDSNYIEVQVNLTTAGSYNISTDTSNGYSFKGSGTFATPGINTVKLTGSGTPAAAGTNLFVITFDSAFCLIQVAVAPPGAGGPAVFTLQGSGGSCSNATPAGTYVKSVPLTSSNNVGITLNVTTIGTYNISTAATNGMTFSRTGTFVATGLQTVTLAGAGTPVSDGASTITLTAGVSSCTFVVNVLATPPPVPAGDYFPRTINSNWSYEFDDTPADSILLKVISATHSVSGNSYNIFLATDNAATGFDSAGYYRKAGGDYFQFLEMGTYFGVDSNTQWIDYNFLKDDRAQGFTWNSSQFVLTDNGFSATLRVKLTILQKDVTVTVKGTSYPNTIVVEEKYEALISGVWQDITAGGAGYYKNYYSKGVGLIKYEHIDPAGAVDLKYELRRHQVL